MFVWQDIIHLNLFTAHEGFCSALQNRDENQKVDNLRQSDD